MRDYQFSIPAGGQERRIVGGNFIKVKSSTVETRIIAENKAGQTIADIGMSNGTWVNLPERFETVRIENDTAGTVSVALTIGTGQVDDSELTGTITASKGTTLDNAGHTVGTSAALLLAANAARRSVIINNEDAGNAIYIGSDATVTAATGLKVSAGQSLSLTNAAGAAIYAIGAAAGLTVKTLAELD
jgi:hypothetical protein